MPRLAYVAVLVVFATSFVGKADARWRRRCHCVPCAPECTYYVPCVQVAPAGPTSARVKGRVTLDGAPLETGAIRLIPIDGKAPTAGATIDGGEFFITNAPLGTVRIEITASKVVGKRKVYDTPDSPIIDIKKQFLPERYNVKTVLTCNLEKGDNELNFELKSK